MPPAQNLKATAKSAGFVRLFRMPFEVTRGREQTEGGAAAGGLAQAAVGIRLQQPAAKDGEFESGAAGEGGSISGDEEANLGHDGVWIEFHYRERLLHGNRHWGWLPTTPSPRGSTPARSEKYRKWMANGMGGGRCRKKA